MADEGKNRETAVNTSGGLTDGQKVLLSRHTAIVRELEDRINGTERFVQITHGAHASAIFRERASAAVEGLNPWVGEIKAARAGDLPKIEAALSSAREVLVEAIDAVRPPPPEKWTWPNVCPVLRTALDRRKPEEA